MKEIIIDGVDVAGYDRYNDFPCKFGESDAICLAHSEQWGGFDKPHCKDRPDCYYKQLKRLEQERNEWKKKYEDVANENLKEIYELIKKNDAWRGIVNVVNGKLEQENAELKAENERLKELKCKFKEYCTCNTEKYVQCLQEIKEIAEEHSTCASYDCPPMFKIINLIKESEG